MRPQELGTSDGISALIRINTRELALSLQEQVPKKGHVSVWGESRH